MKAFWRICFLMPLAVGGVVLGQSGEPPRREPPPGEGGAKPPPMMRPPNEGGPPMGRGDRHPGDERGDKRGGGDRYGPGGRPPMFGEGFERLTEEQKVRVREALGKAWGRPEVSEARDRMMKANEEMRDAIHAALKEIDPEIATLLASMRGPEPWGGAWGDAEDAASGVAGFSRGGGEAIGDGVAGVFTARATRGGAEVAWTAAGDA